MRRRRSSGHAFVEAALVLVGFMTLLVGMLEVAQMLFFRQTLAGRAHDAARWGAVHSFDPAAIRNVVLYGAAAPSTGASPYLGMTASAVTVENPGCPGPDCRIRVSIPTRGIQSTEPVEVSSEPAGSLQLRADR